MREVKIEQTETGWQVFRKEVLAEFKDPEAASTFARELERQEFLQDARTLLDEEPELFRLLAQHSREA